jgi:hypothetical protein
VGTEYCVTSCDLGVFVEEADEPVSSDDLDVGGHGIGQCPQRAGLVQSPVWSMGIEVGFALAKRYSRASVIVSTLKNRCLGCGLSPVSLSDPGVIISV